MKYIFSFALAATAICSTIASPLYLEIRQDDNAIEPYIDSSLPNHTIYFPSGIPIANSGKLPVLIWGNGACSFDGTMNQVFLKHVAANGFIAISEGIMAPDTANTTQATAMSMQGPSNDRTMKHAIDWIHENAGKGKYANVDASRIMTAGFSCGGLEAAYNFLDHRVAAVGIVSSGLADENKKYLASTWKKPVLYVLGGPTDPALDNGNRDFKNIPAGTPKWKGVLPIGHGGDLWHTNGGKFGKAVLNWALWNLKGDKDAAQYFMSGWRADGWDEASADLDKLKPVGFH